MGRLAFAAAPWFFLGWLLACNSAGGGSSRAAADTSANRLGPNAGYVDVVKRDAPHGFYRLNERSGTTAADSSGNGFTGAYNGKVVLGGPALLKGDAATSASFPNGYVSERSAWAAQAVTAECWVRPTAADLRGSPRILSNAWTDHDGNGFMLWLSSGTAAFNTGWTSELGTYPLEPGRVYHLVGTYDKTSGVTLYVNGLEVASAMPGFEPRPQAGDYGGTTYVGALNAPANGGFTGYFQGDVADCAVYDHALTPAQVATHYDAGAREHVAPRPLAVASPVQAPAQTPPPSPLAYDARTACVGGKLYTNTVLPAGEGEFATHGFDRSWWGRTRGNPIGGHAYSGFQTSWGRHQYDTYFGDASDGLPSGHDPFYEGEDTAAPGSPKGLRIAAVQMPPELVGNPAVGGAGWYSGVLDTPVNLQYGFFVARVRLPAPNPGMSPAWWLLSNDGTPKGPHGPLNGEWDVQEMFGNELGNGMNAGTILWNSGANKPQNWGGTYDWPRSASMTPAQNYHDYGALIAPGGAPILGNDYGPGSPGYVYGTVGTGVTDYLDGVPLYGHTGGADVTSGVSWKEMMLMFQVGAQGGWLGSPNAADFPAYYWVQWIRVYKPTATAC